MARCGTLLGLAVGDALGTTHEFEHLDAPPFPKLAAGPLTGIFGGGPLGVARGQVTDDTQMATCLYASLVSYAASTRKMSRRATSSGPRTRATSTLGSRPMALSGS